MDNAQTKGQRSPYTKITTERFGQHSGETSHRDYFSHGDSCLEAQASRSWTTTARQANDNEERPRSVAETSNTVSSSTTLSATLSRPTDGRVQSRGWYHRLRELVEHVLIIHYCMTLQESEVLDRIEASLDDPLALENTGHALFDMTLERRGNLFGDQVYRLCKATDSASSESLPPHHKMSNNDVIVVTLQPRGSGDFYSLTSLPTSENAASFEARVLNQGPSYIDIVVSPAALREDLADEYSSSSNGRRRFRVDRFFSPVPYQRMVAALTQLTTPTAAVANNSTMRMDPLLSQVILSTLAYTDRECLVHGNPEVCDIPDLVG